MVDADPYPPIPIVRFHYDAGHAPRFPGIERFSGAVIHPQQWPEDLDYTGKKVVVIGSGATAVTLVPAMTDRAAHVTMLQRSPSYIVTRPARDRLAVSLTRRLGARRGYAATRWKNVALGTWFYQLSRRRPEKVKALIVQRAIHEFPRAGSRAPWRIRMNYPYDLLVLRYGRINDAAMKFSRR